MIPRTSLIRLLGRHGLAALFGVAILASAYEARAEANDECMECHKDKVPLVVPTVLAGSVHADIDCTDCHELDKPDHGKDVPKVDCASCHDDVAEDFAASVHGKLLADKDRHAPTCTSCHGTHAIYPASDPRSRVYPLNIPKTCGEGCHHSDEVSREHGVDVGTAYDSYFESAHGEGLAKSGLIESAACNDCHGSHKILPRTDPESTVHPMKVTETCGKCHVGVFNTFKTSIHGKKLLEGDKEAPGCTSCHSSHNIKRVSDGQWKIHTVDQCGGCHAELVESYRDTYHGQINRLGGAKVARCSDCHGSHNILPPSDPNSTLAPANIVGTCGKCHEGASEQFTEYLPHATHHDPDKYPILFYVFWAMTLLVVGTFSFFGLHTLLWLFRSLKEGHRAPKIKPTEERMYVRFGLYERALHFLIIVSFLILAGTGLPLKFSYSPWAIHVAEFFGGFEVMGFLHRFAAIITFLYFAMHLGKIFIRAAKGEQLFWGPDSMVPQIKDLQDMYGHFRWFLWGTARPKFDRYTYWEKFDYFAVFWGVGIIGMSGLLLWFPTFFAGFLPGWVFNVAMIVHSDEALLASGFIFSIHFFNSHLRPEKFPLDPVIFTGRVTLEELEHERPLEYARMKKSGKLAQRMEIPVLPWQYTASRIFGGIALAIGIILLILMLSSGLHVLVTSSSDPEADAPKPAAGAAKPATDSKKAADKPPADAKPKGDAGPASGVVAADAGIDAATGAATETDAAIKADVAAPDAAAETGQAVEGDEKKADALADGDKGPEEIKLEAPKAKKGSVVFPHRDHQEMDIACSVCHHPPKGKDASEATAAACKTCHGKTKEAPASKKAYHGLCKTCHKKEGSGPTKCAECHTVPH